MKLNTKNGFRIVLALLFLFLPAANLFAQFEQEDPFADDFEKLEYYEWGRIYHFVLLLYFFET